MDAAEAVKREGLLNDGEKKRVTRWLGLLPDPEERFAARVSRF